LEPRKRTTEKRRYQGEFLLKLSKGGGTPTSRTSQGTVLKNSVVDKNLNSVSLTKSGPCLGLETKPINQYIKRNDRSINRSTRRPTNQAIDRSTYRSIKVSSETTNQSINQLIESSTGRSGNQSIDSPINQPINQSNERSTK
jgi:hypothetical protein